MFIFFPTITSIKNSFCAFLARVKTYTHTKNYTVCYAIILDHSFIVIACCSTKYYALHIRIPGVPIKTDPLVYFDDNFGKYGPILTIFSLLKREIYDAQKLSYFSHLTFIMLLYYLTKQTLILVSMLHVCFIKVNGPQSDFRSN